MEIKARLDITLQFSEWLLSKKRTKTRGKLVFFPAFLAYAMLEGKKVKVKVKSLSRVRLFAIPWSIAYHAPLSMGFSRQEYWSGLPFPFPGDLPNPGIKPGSPTLRADALTSEPPGSPRGKVSQYSHYKKLYDDSSKKKLKIELQVDPEIPLLSTYQKKRKTKTQLEKFHAPQCSLHYLQ